jgi:diguanylate cyclase (GGDEF)-like protein
MSDHPPPAGTPRKPHARQLRDQLLLGAVVIALVVALASMFAVSVVIRQQYLDQSNAMLNKAARVIEDNLNDRRVSLLAATRQLATQKNLGSTLWYLTQYAESGIERETLQNTYLQLLRDTYKLERVAALSRVAIYDAHGNLVTVALGHAKQEWVGFVERRPEPTLRATALKDGEEVDARALNAASAQPGVELRLTPLTRQEGTDYVLLNGKLAIESRVPIMGVAFDPATGVQEIRQQGLVLTAQYLDAAVVEHLSRLTDTVVNVFTHQGFSAGGMPAYEAPDWGGPANAGSAQALVTTFNETTIQGAGYYQCLLPLYTDKRLVGSVAALLSKAQVQKNTWQMVGILGLIALACLLVILPLAWYFANAVAAPLAALSHIFRSVADGGPGASVDADLAQLSSRPQRYGELGELTQSFLAMNQAVSLQMQQINDINASLENSIAQRTQELRLANAELTKLATHDTLTGLPNRNLLADRLQQTLAAARRSGTPMALMFIDLDEFKPVNDTLGHEYGDQLLKEAAQRILGCQRETDTVARIGGDEFVVLLPQVESAEDAQRVAEKIRLTLQAPFELAGKLWYISSSIGIALYPEHGADESTLFKNADAAMYMAKNAGRNTVRLYSST